MPNDAASPPAPRAPRPEPAVLAQTVDDAVVLVDTGSNRIFELNETAAALWRMLEQGVAVPEIARRLAQRYDVSPGDVRDEIRTTLDIFAAHGLLQDDVGG